MSQFEQLKMLYNQFLTLAAEIKSMIDQEEYNEAISKLQHKNTLIQRLATIKKNLALSEEENEEILKIEEMVKDAEKTNLEYMKGLRSEVAAELKKINKTLKVSNAYSKGNSQQQGSILDLSE